MLISHEVSWDRLKIFYTVSQYPSFSAASESLGQTPSTVSRSIRQLEAELHCKLFNRYPEGTELTESGKILLDSIKHSAFYIQSAISKLDIRQERLH